jgi:uncharacterized protein
MPDSPVVTVSNDPAHNRYVAIVDGQVAGFAVYRLEGERTIFQHTIVADEYEGQGVGSTLARVALDDVVATGRKIVPICPFIAAYIERHPEYEQSVAR